MRDQHFGQRTGIGLVQSVMDAYLRILRRTQLAQFGRPRKNQESERDYYKSDGINVFAEHFTTPR